MKNKNLLRGIRELQEIEELPNQNTVGDRRPQKLVQYYGPFPWEHRLSQNWPSQQPANVKKFRHAY